MITNQRQYRISKSWLKRFEEDLQTHCASKPAAGVDPRAHQVMADAIASERDVLQAQIERYELLRDGKITRRDLASLRDLPVVLIEGRIAAHVTQKDLGERLGVAAQQIQRWEATRYAGASLDRLQDTADALGIQIHETVTYGRAA